MKRKDITDGMRVLTPDGLGNVLTVKRFGNECYPKSHIPVRLDKPAQLPEDEVGLVHSSVAYHSRVLKPVWRCA